MLDFTGQVVLITGAGSPKGIGRTIAHTFGRQGAQVEELRYGDAALDLASAELVRAERRVRLSAREFELARCLFSAGGRIVSKETLLVKVWGWESEAVENNVEVYVGFLRKKLAALGSKVKIKAQRSLGYHLEAGT